MPKIAIQSSVVRYIEVRGGFLITCSLTADHLLMTECQRHHHLESIAITPIKFLLLPIVRNAHFPSYRFPSLTVWHPATALNGWGMFAANVVLPIFIFYRKIDLHFIKKVVHPAHELKSLSSVKGTNTKKAVCSKFSFSRTDIKL